MTLKYTRAPYKAYHTIDVMFGVESASVLNVDFFVAHVNNVYTRSLRLRHLYLVCSASAFLRSFALLADSS